MGRYDVVAPFYDAVMGDRDEAAAYVRSLVEKAPSAGAHRARARLRHGLDPRAARARARRDRRRPLPTGNALYLWNLRVFEHVGDSGYRLHTAEIHEAAFEAAQIEEALAGRFRRVRVYDQERSRPSPRSQRLHFVCERG